MEVRSFFFVLLMPPKAAATEAQGLSPLEKQIHGAALAAPEHTLTGDELSVQFSSAPIEEQLLAINGLLKKNLFTAQKGPRGIQYVAVSRGEASLLGSMDANELIIYNHIKEAKNEGIWTKLIKARTNLHQTVMTRCLRLLEQKQLVKSVKSVKFPTRKIYMLYDLTPSIELSGGPWYTDNELDTGFIHELSMACLRFIQSKTWPKDGRSSALYPASHTHQFPTAQQVHRYLRQARLTDTELEQEHVVALLDLLIYDQHIEKIPILPMAFASTEASDDDDHDNDDDDDDDEEPRPRKVRIQDIDSSDSSNEEDNTHTRRRSKSTTRRRREEEDDDSSASDDDRRHRRPAAQPRSVDSESTIVPYVYRAIKPLLEPHSSLICTTFVPPATPTSQCDQCLSLDFDDGVMYADPFTSLNEEDADQKNAVDETPQLGWLESNLS